MSIKDVLNDPWDALDSIYNNQVFGETLLWHYEETADFPYSVEEIDRIVRKTDRIIDLDFKYTSNYEEADLVFSMTSYDVPRNEGGNLGLFYDYSEWGLAEIFYDYEDHIEANINTAVHEFGHYLGLGEPASDPRFDQLDSAMSYNSSSELVSGYQTFFIYNDLEVLLDFHGVEDDNGTGFQGTASGNYLKGTNAKDIIAGFDGNDELRGSQGGDHIFGGNGNDLISGGNGRDYLSGKRRR